MKESKSSCSKKLKTKAFSKFADHKFSKLAPGDDSFSPENLLPDPGMILDTDKFSRLELDSSQVRALRTWPSFLCDHCIFLFAGLNSFPGNDGLRCLVPSSTILSEAVDRLKANALVMTERWHKYQVRMLGQDNLDTGTFLRELVPLWNDTYKLKKAVKTLLEIRKWIGGIDRSFAIEMLAKLFYLRGRLEKTIQPWQELVLFTEDAALHVALAAHYLDGGAWSETQRNLVLDLLKFSGEGFDLRNQIWTAAAKRSSKLSSSVLHRKEINQALWYLREVRRYFQWAHSKKPETTANPEMTRHCINEATFAIRRLIAVKKVSRIAL